MFSIWSFFKLYHANQKDDEIFLKNLILLKLPSTAREEGVVLLKRKYTNFQSACNKGLQY